MLQEGDNLSIVAPSCASLEWCDDIARNDPSRLGFDEEGSPLRLRRANLDWDLESEIAPRALSVASSSLTREVEMKFAPKSSRDLMVMACEMFQPYSPPFRVVHEPDSTLKQVVVSGHPNNLSQTSSEKSRRPECSRIYRVDCWSLHAHSSLPQVLTAQRNHMENDRKSEHFS